jgi:hypothetical protein
VEFVPRPRSEWADPLTLLNDAEYLVIVPSEGSLSFSETPETETGDDAFRVSISLILPKNHPERLAFQRHTKGRRYILIYADRNQTALLIGNTAEPVRLSFERETGAEFSDLNSVKITVNQVFRYPAPFYKDFEADQPGEIQLPGSTTGNNPTTQLMQGRFAYDAPFSYMGLAPLSAAETDNAWKIIRDEISPSGTILGSGTALNVTWTDYTNHTYP